MKSIFLQLILLLTPISAFTAWLLGPVQQQLHQGRLLTGILYMLGGLAVLALVEGLLLKFYMLPRWARTISERLYAGNYIPDDDPLVRLVHSIVVDHHLERIPELERLAQADPRRVRTWQELASIYETLLRQPATAVDALLRGATAVKNPEDAAMLMWRAVSLCKRHPELAEQAPTLRQQLIEQYPHSVYGKLARQTAQ